MDGNYSEENIKTLEWKEHIRLRPGMYIGKLGDGSSLDDGIYVMLKEVMDNAVDEYMMGYGRKIDVSIAGSEVRVRDYGRGIPLGKVLDVSSRMNTGAKYDSKAFKKSVGLNGVGIKAVNALSSSFIIRSFRESQLKEIEFRAGELVRDESLKGTQEENGTEVIFIPDEAMFGNFHYISEYVESMMKNYSYLNAGMIINLNGNKIVSRNGLVDLLNDNMNREGLYPIIHLRGDDIEVALTHGMQYGEDYYSFVNGQHTSQGGTHLIAFREAITRTVKEFFKKDFDASDIRSSIIAAISVKIEEPIFESQTKTKLGSKDMGPQGPTVRNYIVDFIRKHLDDYLHKNGETARIMLKKIQESEKERKAISSIQKLARERAKKVSLHNRKLRDCRIHYNSNDERRLESTLFITEGDSASGSITKSRNVETQAVFSLRGKPLNSYGLTKKIVYENEEFNLLQAALNIEESLDDLRYNQVVIATDADVDGMHIRLLLLTFFLQFFPDLVRKGHVYILQTPLFRVRNKKQTRYCYSDEERLKAIKDLGPDPEITRFKGLGEISPDEFVHFIGKDMRLEPVIMKKSDPYTQFLEFYMGKNTPERQDFIIDNLRVEEEIPEIAQV
ncbi:MAG: type IIA DNA topoisomerase subunit B [Bacteroidales bacterium]|nr:type IIA DNA topoisomerase subunit B [Bacteroidales bacterium]HOO66695.1 DNA topoisomerase IV subunit B [Bacteroidales bacterium]HPE22799.1 DNA topoisomerase IV subunit B [Bacteroidales bacterium]HPJ04361.1 DNA topoisomerase IV subunit B [Bacteroidales bacterium]HPQ64079.1 DNA topoisomerase IV subunit B [Bacteroidales bacterium]